MVKVIKEGHPNSDPNKKMHCIYTATCPYCGCVFEFEEEDFPTVITGNFIRDLHCTCCSKALSIDHDVKTRIEYRE